MGDIEGLSDNDNRRRDCEQQEQQQPCIKSVVARQGYKNNQSIAGPIASSPPLTFSPIPIFIAPQLLETSEELPLEDTLSLQDASRDVAGLQPGIESVVNADITAPATRRWAASGGTDVESRRDTAMTSIDGKKKKKKQHLKRALFSANPLDASDHDDGAVIAPAAAEPDKGRKINLESLYDRESNPIASAKITDEGSDDCQILERADGDKKIISFSNGNSALPNVKNSSRPVRKHAQEISRKSFPGEDSRWGVEQYTSEHTSLPDYTEPDSKVPQVVQRPSRAMPSGQTFGAFQPRNKLTNTQSKKRQTERFYGDRTSHNLRTDGQVTAYSELPAIKRRKREQQGEVGPNDAIAPSKENEEMRPGMLGQHRSEDDNLDELKTTKWKTVGGNIRTATSSRPLGSTGGANSLFRRGDDEQDGSIDISSTNDDIEEVYPRPTRPPSGRVPYQGTANLAPPRERISRNRRQTSDLPLTDGLRSNDIIYNEKDDGQILSLDTRAAQKLSTRNLAEVISTELLSDDNDSPDPLAREENDDDRSALYDDRKLRSKMRGSSPPKSTSVSENGNLISTVFAPRNPDKRKVLPKKVAEAVESFSFSRLTTRHVRLSLGEFQFNDKEQRLDPYVDGSAAGAEYPGLPIYLKQIIKIIYSEHSNKLVIYRSQSFHSGGSTSVQFVLHSEKPVGRFVQIISTFNPDINIEVVPKSRIERVFENHEKQLDDFQAKRHPDDIARLEAIEKLRNTEVSKVAISTRQLGKHTARDNLKTQSNRNGPPSPETKLISARRMTRSIAPTIYESLPPRREIRDSAATDGPRVTRSSSSSKQPVETYTRTRTPSPERWSFLNTGWRKKWNTPLIYPPEGKKQATINADDIVRLDEGEYLNDNLLVFYLRYLEENIFKQHPEMENRVYFQNSFFYEALTKHAKKNSIDYEAVRRWTRKVDIFSYDYIIVPVNERAHWYLAIICNPRELLEIDSEGDEESGNIPTSNNATHASSALSSTPHTVEAENGHVDLNNITETTIGMFEKHVTEKTNKDPIISDLPDLVNKLASTQLTTKTEGSPRRKYYPKDPRIITLDSLELQHSPTCVNLRKYLRAEAADKKQVEIKIPGSFGMSAKHIPLQSNYCDCGIFVLAYVEKFLQDPDGFVNYLLTKKIDEGKSWTTLDASQLRTSVRNILFDLKKAEKPVAAKTGNINKLSKLAEKSNSVEKTREPDPQNINDYSFDDLFDDEEQSAYEQVNSTNALVVPQQITTDISVTAPFPDQLSDVAPESGNKIGEAIKRRSTLSVEIPNMTDRRLLPGPDTGSAHVVAETQRTHVRALGEPTTRREISATRKIPFRSGSSQLENNTIVGGGSKRAGGDQSANHQIGLNEKPNHNVARSISRSLSFESFNTEPESDDQTTPDGESSSSSKWAAPRSPSVPKSRRPQQLLQQQLPPQYRQPQQPHPAPLIPSSTKRKRSASTLFSQASSEDLPGSQAPPAPQELPHSSPPPPPSPALLHEDETPATAVGSGPVSPRLTSPFVVPPPGPSPPTPRSAAARQHQQHQRKRRRGSRATRGGRVGVDVGAGAEGEGDAEGETELVSLI